MRITFVLPAADYSGGLRVVVTYADILAKRGHDVTVVSRPGPKITLRERLSRLIKRREWLSDAQPTGSHLDTLSVPQRRLSRRRPIRASDVPDADVVIATWWETAEWVSAYPAAKGTKVHFIQDYELWGGSKDRVDATCRLPMPKITPARWVKTLLETEFQQTDITVIPNAVDTEHFTSPPRRRQARPTVGFVYTDFRAKGCDISIEAIRLARKRMPTIDVVSFGATQPTSSLPLPDGTEFHFKAADGLLPSLYSKCDVLLFGTRKEGFGLPILEAMACRTPVIGTPAGAAPELLANGGGVLVPMEDPQAMADALVALFSMDESQWRDLSDRAFETASGHSWNTAADMFEQTLVRVAAQG